MSNQIYENLSIVQQFDNSYHLPIVCLNHFEYPELSSSVQFVTYTYLDHRDLPENEGEFDQNNFALKHCDLRIRLESKHNHSLYVANFEEKDEWNECFVRLIQRVMSVYREDFLEQECNEGAIANRVQYFK